MNRIVSILLLGAIASSLSSGAAHLAYAQGEGVFPTQGFEGEGAAFGGEGSFSGGEVEFGEDIGGLGDEGGGVLGGDAISKGIGGLLGGGGAVPVLETNPLLNIDAITQQWWIQIERVLVANLKHQLIQTLTNMTLGWIQGGGDPRFITDWGKYFGNVAFGAAAKWFKDLSGIDICEPFRGAILPAFDPRRILTPPNPNIQFECTLDRFLAGTGNIGNRIGIFRNNFAAGGGWDAWLALASPENNPYWILYNGAQAQSLAVAATTENARSEAVANQGFLGNRKCLETFVDESGEQCIRWQVTTPGALVNQIAGQLLGASEKDLIVNTDDLAGLVGALTNLMINRIFSSGEGGLLGLGTPGIPTGGVFSQSGCAGLVGAARTVCIQEQASEPNCGVLFQQFTTTLRETRSAKQDSLAELDALVGALFQLREKQCRDTSSEIATRQNQRVGIRQDIERLSSDIQTFSQASCDLVPPRALEAYAAELTSAQNELAQMRAAQTSAKNELASCRQLQL